MTCAEFSNEFDILYNNIESNQAPGLDEYEKSVFLTMAQEDIIKNYYSSKNNYSNSFEQTEEVRRYLSSLIKTATIQNTTSSDTDTSETISDKSTVFQLPDSDENKLWFITYEEVLLKDDNLGCFNNNNKGLKVPVIPITQDEYSNIKENPFKKANKRRALRMDISDNKVEIISDYKIESYKVRYISKPSPIILESLLGSNLSINGISDKTECKLNPVIHRAILERAVQLASLAYKQ